jgi:malonyl CoA-acyl carrier protein transacylase/3-oxoacyl-(acyl-carrier-protein) synthase/acyl carrier protein/NAD(P)-dependent dehydrogenase (short-subunit alcohol dehydrogenase family)
MPGGGRRRAGLGADALNRGAPSPAELSQPERLVIDFGDPGELLEKLAKARKAAGFDNPQAWKALAAQGIFRGSGRPAGKIAFLFPGQGSQYSNMGRELAALEPVVAETFREADAVMTPILGRSLTSYIFVDSADPAAMKQAERDLMQTAITQPAMLTMDTAFYKLMGQYGFQPDMVMGHSLGEYGALIAAGIMPFAHALEASAARGAEMTKVSMDDNGWMAAVMAPYDVIMQTLSEIDGYVVAANINSYNQCVVGGASKAVEQAIERFTARGFQAMRIPVSHAFHTKIVAPASKPLRKVLDRLSISEPALPLVANVTGELYPTTVEGIKDILELQIASPVQWVKGLETLYREGCRVFVEVGPKKALKGFVDDVLGSKPDVVSLFTNHPKTGELASFNQALCGLYAAGYGVGEGVSQRMEDSGYRMAAATVAAPAAPTAARAGLSAATEPAAPQAQDRSPITDHRSPILGTGEPGSPITDHRLPITDHRLPITDHRLPITDPPKEPVMSQPALPADALGQLAQVLQQAMTNAQPATRTLQPYDRNEVPLGSVVVSGTGLGLPGPHKPLMDPDNALRILRGEQFIDLIPERFRQRILDKRITRLVKAADGAGSFQVITDPAEVLKLAGRAGQFDLAEEYGVPAKLVEALDITTQYAFAAGLDALREAGIPLVQTWRKTTTGKFLPDRWLLPEALRDETGVIFASAFPGGDRFAEEFAKYYQWENRRMQLAMLEDLRGYTSDMQTLQELSRRIGDLREQMEREPYNFDRRFIFRILSMGHSQFAEYIGARGPNAHVNAACASTAQGIALAEDWIRNGRCRRVLVLGGDAVTSDNLMEWVGAGFLALGASATDDRVDEAALPFDRRRHGTILGMGACGLVVESEDAVRERGMRGIVELLSSETMNSAFHGSRLDVDHISQVMESLVAAAERRFGVNRYAMASQTVFMSHETYTPARGGSASAEVIALRNTFGAAASDVVVANTKGFTGHPMGVGVEDVIAVKILEYGIVPPVPNFKEVDPDLGVLNLSRGGRYPVLYALHLAAGFGSQISLTLTRRIPGGLDRVDDKLRYQHWLDGASGYDRAELEVIKRNLRIKSLSGPGRAAAPSPWRYGFGPSVRSASPGDGNAAASYHPQPMPAVRDLLQKGTGGSSGEVRETPAAPAPVVEAPRPVVAPPPAPAPKPAPVIAPAAQPLPTPPPAAAPAPAAPAAPAAPPVPPAPSVNPVTSQVLGIVAEKTGYPQDMLDLDLDLEADLGIDTVKQAETFQAVREAFSIPQQEGMSLRDYPTLESVIGFVHKMRPDLAEGERSTVNGEQTAAAPSAPITDHRSPITDHRSPVTATVLGIVADKTGYPQDMLDLDLDLEADLGIDTVKQAETFQAVREAFSIPQQEGMSLRDYPTLESVIGFVHTMRPDLAEGERSTVNGEQTSAAPSAPITDHRSPITDHRSPVTATVMGIVAEKTGYPQDMLELDLDLEADLGIDTVKQAETFQAVREAFSIPQQEGMSLRDYPTLGSVIGFVHTMRPDLAEGERSTVNGERSTVSGEPTAAAPSAPITDHRSPITSPSAVAATVLGIVAAKTGYPEDMLELDLDLEADLGIDTVKQAETLQAIREAYNIPFQENLALRDYPTLESVIGFVYTMRPDLAEGERSTVNGEQTAAAPSAPITDHRSPITDHRSPVTATVLGIVAAKTGYPEDMLELDLDLEADLGIDTVKQAETMQAIREAYNIPFQENLALRDYPTLQSVIGFVYTMRPDLAEGERSTVNGERLTVNGERTTEVASSAPTSGHRLPITDHRSPVTVQTIGTLEDADRMPRRVPVPSLRPAIELCKSTGVSLGSGSRVAVMLDRGGVGKALVNRLEKLGAAALTLEPGIATDALEAQLKGWLAEGPIQGVYWLPALDVEAAIEEMSLEEWREANRLRVKNLYTAMRTLYDAVTGPNTFLVSATRLGGLHGYGAAGATAPLGGAVSGFTKAYHMEQALRAEDAGKGITVKVVDFGISRKTAEPADALLAETLFDPGIVEVGYKDGLRYTVTLVEKPARDGQSGMALDKETVFVVTGAAGGITSAITTDLAVHSGGGIFYLLDLVSAPARDDQHVKLFREGREVLKQALIAEARASGEKVTPKQIDDKIMGIERGEAALRAIEAVEAAGGVAHYFSLDLRDGDKVAAVVEDIRVRYGKIDVLLHAGGLLIDRTLPNKEPHQFALVFDVKADGFFNLMKAAKGLPIGATVSFSSVAGRFGNNGQSDYSSANDLLCKISSSMRAWRPEARGIAIDWTAWGQIGMASRGSVPAIMAALGIDMLPAEAGVPTIRRELTYGGTRGEIVVAGRLGAWMDEKDATGGVDLAKINAALAQRQPRLLMVGEVKATKLYGGVEVETRLDPNEQPFLYDHAPDAGTPWLPGVMATEALAELATVLTGVARSETGHRLGRRPARAVGGWPRSRTSR